MNVRRPSFRRRPADTPPRAAPAARPALWSNVVAISLTTTLATTWYLTWSPVVPLLLAHAGAGAPAIAGAFAATNLAFALSQYLGGRLADRFGVRVLIGLTGVALGLAWLGMSVSSRSWEGLALFFLVGNLLFGLQATAFVTVVSDSVAPAQRTRAFAYFWSWNAVAYVLGPIVGGFVILPHLPPAAYLGVTAAVYGVVGAIRFLTLREPRPEALARRPRLTLAGALHAAAGSDSRRRLLVLTVGVTLTFALTVSGPFLVLATHGLDHAGTRLVDVLFGIGAVGGLIAGRVASRAAHPAVGVARGLAVHAAAALAAAVALPRAMVFATYVLLFAGYQVATVAFSTLRVELAGSEDVGEVLGATSAAAGVAAFAGLLLGGVIGNRASLVLAAAVAAATAAWCLRVLVPTPAADGRAPVLPPAPGLARRIRRALAGAR